MPIKIDGVAPPHRYPITNTKDNMYIVLIIAIAIIFYVVIRKKTKANPDLALDDSFSNWLKAYQAAVSGEKEQLARSYASMVFHAGEKFRLISSEDRNEFDKHIATESAAEMVSDWLDVALPSVKGVVSADYVAKSPAWLIGALMLASIIDLVPERGIRQLLARIT